MSFSHLGPELDQGIRSPNRLLSAFFRITQLSRDSRMPRIFGYLVDESDSEHLAEYTKYAALHGGDTPNVPAASICVASQTSTADGVHIGLAGRAIWRGDALNADNAAVILNGILARYRSAGAGVLDEIDGAFSLAIVDSGQQRALLAVDRMGIERMTYATSGGRLVFGSLANSVADFPGFKKSLRDQAIFDFLFMHMIPAPETVYEGIFKLPPASVLEFDSGRVTVRTYWQPSYDYAGGEDFESLKTALHTGLKSAVKASGLNESSGAFLSGGLDSSSIAGTLAGMSSEPAKTFTIGFGAAEKYDELKYSRLANAYFGCQAFEYQMTPADIVDVFPRIAEVYDEPFGNSSAAPTYCCARLAADNGVNHMLAGDGGDELFGGNERYVRQSIFEVYGRVPGWLRRGLIEPMSRFISPESRIMPLRKIRSYVDQALIPLPERFESWNFMYREGREQMLDRDFADSIDKDAPLHLMRDVWESAPADDLLDRMLWYDWRFTLADNDLRKVGTMCELAGVRVSYPFLHPDIVGLSTRIPSRMKIRGTELRSFFKRAMSGFLPQEILKKKKHGFGLPFGLWLKTDKDLADLIYSSLSDLKKRRIIDAAFIDNLIAQHLEGHASYFGYAIWDLAMLEAWLARHIDRSKA